jgi:hypothetical protein
MSTTNLKQARNDNPAHSPTTAVPTFATQQASTPPAPQFFPMPQRGHDPHFGLGRSSFYDLEKRGMLRLIRLRKPGNIRGKVLVPYAETAALIRRLATGGNTTP